MSLTDIAQEEEYLFLQYLNPPQFLHSRKLGRTKDVTLSTIFSATGLASKRYSLNCSSEQSAAAPCVSTSSRGLGQKDFTKPKAWLTHVVGASAMKLRTFCGAPRSHSSRDRSPALSPSCGSTISTSCWAAPLGPPALSSAAPFLRQAS
jgi:hypothetical protein